MIKIFHTFFLFIFLILAKNAYAQIGLDSSKQLSGLKIKTDDAGLLFSNLLRNTIMILFAVGGLGFTIMIMWGAVDWILSGGDKEKIAGARKRITTALVGLVLLSLTFVILVVVGQITGIEALQTGNIPIPGLLDKR